MTGEFDPATCQDVLDETRFQDVGLVWALDWGLESDRAGIFAYFVIDWLLSPSEVRQ